ncbi:MAG: hypothetical protein RLZZ156_1703 [Deinococcota bacterium]
MSDRSPAIRIREFPDNGIIYRMAWFGGITKSNRNKHLIKALLLDETNDDKGNIVNIGVSALPLLPLGSRWQGGIRLSDLESEYQTKNILVDADSIQFVDVDHFDGYTAKKQKQLLIPQFFYSLGKRFYGVAAKTHVARCKGYIENMGVDVIIPVPVLIQFYWGTSTALINSVFDTTFAGVKPEYDKFFHPDRSSVKNGIVHLELRHRYLPADGAVIARAMCDPIALASAQMIARDVHAAFANQHQNPDSVFNGLKMNFPFRGSTNLRVFGKWDRSMNKFLVLRIQFCDHPFPFDSLELPGGEKIIKLIQKARRDEKPILAREFRPKRLGAAKNPVGVEAQNPTHPDRVGIKIDDLRNRFPDLKHKIKRQRRYTREVDEIKYLPNKNVGDSAYGLDDAEPGAENPPAVIGDEVDVLPIPPIPFEEKTERKPIKPYAYKFPFLQDVVKIMNTAKIWIHAENSSFTIQPVTVAALFQHGSNSHLDNEIPLSIFPEIFISEEDTNDFGDWLRMDEEERFRVCAVIQVIVHDKVFYVFDLSRKPVEQSKCYRRLILWKSNFSEFSTTEIDDYLEATARNFRRRTWASIADFPNYFSALHPHNTFNPDICANSLLSRFLIDGCKLKRDSFGIEFDPSLLKELREKAKKQKTDIEQSTSNEPSIPLDNVVDNPS